MYIHPSINPPTHIHLPPHALMLLVFCLLYNIINKSKNSWNDGTSQAAKVLSFSFRRRRGGTLRKRSFTSRLKENQKSVFHQSCSMGAYVIYDVTRKYISFPRLPHQKVSCLKTGFLINFVSVSAVCHDRGSTSSKRSSDGSCLPEIKIQEVADRVRSDKIIRRHSLTWGYKSSANFWKVRCSLTSLATPM